MIRAVVSGTIVFSMSECPHKVIERLRFDLSFPNPEHITRRRMGRYTGGIPERIECLIERDGRVEIPRGAVCLLRQHLAQAGMSVEFENRRYVHPPVELRADVELRSYQADAVVQMCRGVQGVVVMPCGGGKTVIGMAAVARIGQPALVIVHTRDLLEQWRETIHRILGIEAGIVAEGACDPSTVTVATVQTLVRLPLDQLDALAARFGCVIVDEAHHAPASTFQAVLSRMPARYRYGLTATPQREDGLTSLLDFTLGERLFEIGYPELVAAGYLEAPEVRPIYSNFHFDYTGPEDYHACMAALIDDAGRNDLIVDLAVREAREGHAVMVLSGRVEHCRQLASLISDRDVRAEVLVGGVKKPDRRRILDELRSGELPVVVASTLADEGLDVPRLGRIILAFPSRSKGRTAQRIGRLMRPYPGKQGAVLFDIVDATVRPLHRQYLERRRSYDEQSHTGQAEQREVHRPPAMAGLLSRPRGWKS